MFTREAIRRWVARELVGDRVTVEVTEILDHAASWDAPAWTSSPTSIATASSGRRPMPVLSVHRPPMRNPRPRGRAWAPRTSLRTLPTAPAACRCGLPS